MDIAEQTGGDFRDFTPETKTWEFSSKPEYEECERVIEQIQQDVLALLAKKFPKEALSEEFKDFLELFVVEVYSNALYHGNYGLHDKIGKSELAQQAEAKHAENRAFYDKLKVVVSLEIFKTAFKLSVRDFGEGFSTERVKLPEDLRAPSGRGMFLVVNRANDAGFEPIKIENLTQQNPPEQGTRVILEKRFN